METAPKIEDNRVVALRFTVSDGGVVLDRVTESAPLVYLHGHGNIAPGLEVALAGQEVGHRFDLELPPEDAFGPRMEEAERVVPRDAFPTGIALAPGLELAMEDEGEVIPFWIKEVHDTQIVIDLNHPLAGRTLRFEGEVLRVREATADELEHGHPHGLEGTEPHHH